MQSVLNCDLLDGQRREVPSSNPSGSTTPSMRRIMREGPQLILREPPYRPAGDTVMFGDVGRPSASVMAVPLRQEGRPVGVLSIQSYKPNAYSREDLQTLQALADHCAGALERLRAEEARRQSEELNRSILATAMDGYYAVDFSADPRGALVAFVIISSSASSSSATPK